MAKSKAREAFEREIEADAPAFHARPSDLGGVLRCRSTIGGALGDEQFEVGDLIDVPSEKYDEWLAAGHIEPHRGDS